MNRAYGSLSRFGGTNYFVGLDFIEKDMKHTFETA